MNKLSIYKITGSPTEQGTTQIHDFDIGDKKLFILATLTSSETNLSRMETIRGVVNFLHHNLTDSDFNFQAFKSEIEKSATHPPFDIGVVLIVQNIAYIFGVGTSAFLIRDNKTNEILKTKESLSGASGIIKEGDLLCLGTNAFCGVVSPDSVFEYYSKKALKNLETDFEVNIEKDDKKGEIGGLILMFGENKEEELNEEIEIEPQKEEAPPLFMRKSSFSEARSRNKKGTLIGAALLMLLAIGIFFGFKAKKNKDETRLVQKTIESAQNALSEARTLSLLNKSKARDLIYDARAKIAMIESKSAKFPEVKGMSDEIKDSLGAIGGIYEESPSIFSDLSLVSGNMRADDINISDDSLRVLGKEANRAISIGLSGKKTETLDGQGHYSSPKKIIAYTKRTFIWEDGGIHEYGGNKASLPTTISADNALVEAFAGNLYVLEKSQNAIWRYIGSDTSFSAQSSWLAPGITVDLSKANSMAIDGAIWILTSSGKVLKFNSGNPQTVSLQGLDSPLGEGSKLFTSDEVASLYVLDAKAKAVYVFTKNGEFVGKYQNEQIGNATSLVVSENQKIMILAAGSKLLSLDLKHLK